MQNTATINGQSIESSKPGSLSVRFAMRLVSQYLCVSNSARHHKPQAKSMETIRQMNLYPFRSLALGAKALQCS